MFKLFDELLHQTRVTNLTYVREYWQTTITTTVHHKHDLRNHFKHCNFFTNHPCIRQCSTPEYITKVYYYAGRYWKAVIEREKI